jgi:hypothetical protein
MVAYGARMQPSLHPNPMLQVNRPVFSSLCSMPALINLEPTPLNPTYRYMTQFLNKQKKTLAHCNSSWSDTLTT